MNILANSKQNRQQFYDQQQIEYDQQQIEYDQQQIEQQQQQRDDLFILRTRYNNIPLSFKGMILLQLWRKCQSNSFNQYLQQQKQQRDDEQDKRRMKQLVKRQQLIRWYFNVYKSRVIRQTISRILCQQSICRGSFFYKLKKLIGQQQQQQQQQQRQIQRQRQQEAKLKHQQQNQQQQHQWQQQQEQESVQQPNEQQQLKLQQQNQRSLQQLQYIIDSRQLSISHISEYQNHIDLQEDNDGHDQTVSRILLDIQENQSNQNNDNDQNDSMIHLGTIFNNNINKQMINQSEQQQIVINIQSNLYDAEDNLYNINNGHNLYNVPESQQRQIVQKPIVQKNQTININQNNKQFESIHIQTVQYKQQCIQTTQTQLINTQNANNFIIPTTKQSQQPKPIQIPKQSIKQQKHLYLSQQQQDETDRLIKQYQKQMLLQFTKLNKIMRHIDQLQQQQ